MKINVLDDKGREAMKKAVEPVWKKYTDDVFGKELVDGFVAEVNKH